MKNQLSPLVSAAIRVLDLGSILKRLATTEPDKLGFLDTLGDVLSREASIILDEDRERTDQEGKA